MKSDNIFACIPRNPSGHFALMYFAAVYRLLDYVRHLGEYGGEPMQAIYRRYPFLAACVAEMSRFMPKSAGWDSGADWWRTHLLGWERMTRSHLPLKALEDELALGFEARLAFVLIGLVEEDSRFATLFDELQAPLNLRRPSLELVGRVMQQGQPAMGLADAWSLCRPLFDAGLVEAENSLAARSEWALRVPSLLWDAARGRMANQPVEGCRYYPQKDFPAVNELILPADLLERLARIPPMLASGELQSVVIRADPGSDALDLMGALARSRKRGVLKLDMGEANQNMRPLLGAWCVLSRSLPVVCFNLSPGETAELPFPDGYRGPFGVLLGREGGLSERAVGKSLSIDLPQPDCELRREHWRRVLKGRSSEDFEAIVDRLHVGGDYIRQMGAIAITRAELAGRDGITLQDVREAARSLNRQQLDSLSNYLDAGGSWNDLVVGPTTRAKLQELNRRCLHRERLLAHLGPAFGGNANRGVRALFSGASGTGKTMAAKILAAELGMDVYRVDLASVVSKYIGETEKNLQRILTYAEALDVILLLDEGDALLGSRTEVKSSNDRYANLETNYLLQRLENYQGIVVVTTNLSENIDRAFKRRMDVVVPFFVPQAQERLGILDLHLPENHQISQRNLQQVALRCHLTGGQLRNVVLGAALLAMGEEQPISWSHFEAALKTEYRKAGGVYPLYDGSTERKVCNDEMAAFISALQER